MPSLRERLSKAVSALRGKEERAMPLPMESVYGSRGMGPDFKPAQSLAAYGDSVWLYGAVTKVAQEIARTDFRIERKNRNGEFEPVQFHQALETLAKPSAQSQC